MTRRLAFVLAAMTILLAACGGAPTEPRDFEFGRIDVYVRESNGDPVDGAQVRLERRGGAVEDPGGLTGSVGRAGYYFFLRVSGDFRIVVTPPAGYEFAPGQSPSADVTFRRNEEQSVTFTLRRV